MTGRTGSRPGLDDLSLDQLVTLQERLDADGGAGGIEGGDDGRGDDGDGSDAGGDG